MKSYLYFNLHRRLWSRMVRGKVLNHWHNVGMVDVEFRVRPGGRAKVLREGRKNVHAFAVGVAYEVLRTEDFTLDPEVWTEVTYNPFRAGFFYRKSDGREVLGAASVLLTEDKRVWAAGLQLGENRIGDE